MPRKKTNKSGGDGGSKPEEKKPEKFEDQYGSRRNFLVALGVVGASATGIAYLTYQMLQDTERPNWRERGDSSTPLEQQHANEVYALLYDSIKKAKDEAGDGKKLIILTGEHHHSKDAFMIKWMVQDICERLKIPGFAMEFNDEIINRHKVEWNKDKKVLRDMQAMLLTDKFREAPAAVRGGEFFQKFVRDASFCLLADDLLVEAEKKTTSKEDKEYGLFEIVGRLAHLRGLDVIAGDPKYPERMQDAKDPELEEKREAAMMGKLAGLDKDCAGAYGLHHLPVLVEALDKDPRKKVLGFDIANMEPTSPGVAERHDSRKGMREELIAKGKIVDVVVQGKEPSMDEAGLFALRAGVEHRNKIGEITKTEYQCADTVLNWVNEVQRDTHKGRTR